MISNYTKLSKSEQIVFTLRELYGEYGFERYKMRKFEEYDLYSKNKDFLVSDSVITFTDTNGKLMALKPDVTLSIVKNTKDTPGAVQKLCYDEHVYRVAKGTHSFKEISQVGLECIGDVDTNAICEVLLLAAKSLEECFDDFVIDVSNLDVLSVFLNHITDSVSIQKDIIKCVSEKNTHGIDLICATNDIDISLAGPLKELLGLYGEPSSVLDKIGALAVRVGAKTEFEGFANTVKALGTMRATSGTNIRIDFSLIDDMNYYNGLVFKGFALGIPEVILSGGQYDKLMKKLHRKAHAIGFAIYLDMLEYLDTTTETDDDTIMLNVALPKGRLGEKVYTMFEQAGFECPSIKEKNRKLIFENKQAGVRYFWVKPSDVAIYVERGAADIGVCGKDILLEYEPEIYELLDMNLGKCRMCVAAPSTFKDDTSKVLRVATKFSNIASSYYSSMGRDIDIIHLNGSIEIAPILGLSDVIVDIVETGTTLKENNLKVFEEVVPISARLISNKSSHKSKTKQIEKLVKELGKQVKEND